ncbi:MAG: hypothetical protein HY722_13135 [Planctomycetes bacterium]|nr:hypothetical protein [Planctomycetota bacterium]
MAYLGQGSRRLLPVRSNSRGGEHLLVVNMDEDVVRAASSDPREALWFLKRGVEVHSNPRLHAKICVLGQVALVGSMNASHDSRDTLAEAALETRVPRLVRAAARLVEDLRDEPMTADRLRQLVRIYGSARRARRRRVGGAQVVREEPGWVVPLVFTRRWSDRTIAADRRARPRAKRKMEHPRTNRLDAFAYHWNDFTRRLERGETVGQCFTKSNGTYVSHPARVILVRRIRGSVPGEGAIVYLEQRHVRNRSLKRVLRRLRRGSRSILSTG